MVAIQIKVKGGECRDGIHDVGQVFIVKDRTPAGICLRAWSAVAPYVTILRCGGTFSWESTGGIAIVHCPDAEGITLELQTVDGSRG